MLYRFAAFVIVTFWLVMTSLLVLNEIHPEGSSVQQVPLPHVMKVLYLHEQPSDLRIYAGNTSIGYMRLHPHIDKETGDRLLEITGNLQMQLGESHSRIVCDGILTMSPAFDLKKTDWSIAMQDPGGLRLQIQTQATSPTAHLILRTKDQIIQESDVALNESGFSGVMQQFGATPEMLAMVDQAKTTAKAQAPPVIRARQSSLRYRGERTDTYLVSIEQNGQTLIECHFSQLGQVLYAKTLLGYTLQPDDVIP
jgi:hypothetical protein